MATRFFQRTFISNLLLIISILGTAVLISSSSKILPKESAAKTSISLNITFKSNINEELRARAISAIENNWIRSFPQLTNKDADKYLTFTVTKLTSGNDDKYQLSLLNNSDDCCLPTRPVPCPPCPGICPACSSLNDSYGILAIEEAK